MIKQGVNRTVLLVGPVAIKFPSWRNGARYFVSGQLGNILEAEHWRMSQHPNLAQVYHRGPLGLWLVMKRYRFVLCRRLTERELETLPFINIDNNGHNVAVEESRLILLDYGNSDWYLDISD